MTTALIVIALLGCPRSSPPTNPQRAATNATATTVPDVATLYAATIAERRAAQVARDVVVAPDAIWLRGPVEPEPPPPFDESALRTGMPTGLRVAWRLTRMGVAPVDQRLVVTAADDAAATLYTSTYQDNLLLGEPVTATLTWAQLRARSAFPAKQTTRQRAGILLGEKRHDGWLYVVREPDGETVTEHAFVDTMPGAPVRQVQRRANDEIYKLELLYHRPPER